jgi:2-methoxy-6-polyprenyl-1,4-benzoquinol methylase
MHRLWKDRLVEKLRPRPGQRHLDVAGGTGDVAFRVWDAMRAAHRGGGGGSFASAAWPVSASSATDAQQQERQQERQREREQQQQQVPPVTVCDINASMLAEGRRRAEARGIGPEGIAWVEGNAEALPFADATFDSYTVAFGIRNVTDRPAALREALRCGAQGWGGATSPPCLLRTAVVCAQAGPGWARGCDAGAPSALRATPTPHHARPPPLPPRLQGAAAWRAAAVPGVQQGGGAGHAAALRPLLLQRHTPDWQVGAGRGGAGGVGAERGGRCGRRQVGKAGEGGPCELRVWHGTALRPRPRHLRAMLRAVTIGGHPAAFLCVC